MDEGNFQGIQPVLFDPFPFTLWLFPSNPKARSSEKRLIEIDLSLENVQRQPSTDLSQKAQPLPARPPQTQPVPQATISPTKEEIKSSTAKQLKQEERQSQVQSPPKPAEAEIREVQTSQVQTAPQPKEETKGQTAEHPGQGERLLQAKEISQKPASQEREGKDLQAQTNKSVETLQDPHLLPHRPVHILQRVQNLRMKVKG
jgi:hypothetical protein